jgi:hypothetical protein
MNRPPVSVFVTLLLILLNAAFWLGFAILLAAGGIRSLQAESVITWVMVNLAVISAMALAGIAFLLRRRSRFAYYVGLALLALIAVLSITDQVGLLDLFTLLVNLVALGLMVKDRAWYLQRDKAVPTGVPAG